MALDLARQAIPKIKYNYDACLTGVAAIRCMLTGVAAMTAAAASIHRLVCHSKISCDTGFYSHHWSMMVQ